MSQKRIDWRETFAWSDDTKLARTDDISAAQVHRAVAVLVTVALGGIVGLVGWRAYDGGDSALAWLGVGTVAIGLLAIVLKNFELGLVGFLWVAWLALKTPAVAQGQSGGGAQGLQIAHAGLSALLGLWIARSLFGVRAKPARHALWWPVGLHLFFCGLSTMASVLFPDSNILHYSKPTNPFVNLIDWLTRFLSLGGMVLVGANLSGRWVDRAGVALVGTTVLAFVGFLLHMPHPLYIEFAFIMPVGVLAAMTLLGYGPLWLRWLSGATALLIFGMLLLAGTEWVSGWMGAGIALFVTVWVLRRKLLWIGVAAILLMIAVRPMYFYEKFYVMNFYAGKVLKSRTASGGTFENDRSRMLLGAARYANEFPLGIGLGNYRAAATYYGRPDVWNTTIFSSAHGTFAQTLTEVGWPGLVTLFWILFASLKMNWTYWLRSEKVSKWRRCLLIGSFGGVVGNFCAAFLGDYLFPTYHNGGMGSIGACVYTWLYLGLVLAIGRDDSLEPSNAPKEKWKPRPPVLNRPISEKNK